MEKIVLVGSQGHAKVVIDILECEAKYSIVGLIDRFREVGETTLGYGVLGAEEDIPRLAEHHSLSGILIAIGDNHVRFTVTNKIAEICPDIQLVSAIHPDASIGRDVIIGQGTAVMAGTTINPGCRIGRSCILNTSSSLDHDSAMGDFASLGPRAVTGGYTEIGAFSAVGIGATVSNSLKIGPHAVIGAGSTVLNDIEAFSIAYGTPARIVRSRTEGEPYLKAPRVPDACK